MIILKFEEVFPMKVYQFYENEVSKKIISNDIILFHTWRNILVVRVAIISSSFRVSCMTRTSIRRHAT